MSKWQRQTKRTETLNHFSSEYKIMRQKISNGDRSFDTLVIEATRDGKYVGKVSFDPELLPGIVQALNEAAGPDSATHPWRKTRTEPVPAGEAGDVPF